MPRPLPLRPSSSLATPPGLWIGFVVFSGKSESLSLAKRIPITEKVRAVLRADAQGPFNFVRWSNPSTTITSSTFGKVTGGSGWADDTAQRDSGILNIAGGGDAYSAPGYFVNTKAGNSLERTDEQTRICNDAFRNGSIHGGQENRQRAGRRGRDAHVVLRRRLPWWRQGPHAPRRVAGHSEYDARHPSLEVVPRYRSCVMGGSSSRRPGSIPRTEDISGSAIVGFPG